jgi:hypothetical protein
MRKNRSRTLIGRQNSDRYNVMGQMVVNAAVEARAGEADCRLLRSSGGANLTSL